jgi:hypothetical protein
MDRQTAGVTDIGNVIEELQAVDETTPCGPASRQLEADKATELAFQIFVCALTSCADLPRRMNNFDHFRSFAEISCYRGGILDMPLDPKRQRIYTLQRKKGVERRESRTQIAQEGGACLDDIGDRAKRFDGLRPYGAMIARIWLVQGRLTLGETFPVEIAAIDDDAADGIAMAADIFRCRVDDDCSTVIERTREQRSRRIVDDERDAIFAPDSRDFCDREDDEFRIGQCLGIKGAGSIVSCTPEIFRIGRVDKTDFYTLRLQRIGEKIQVPP